MGLSAKQDVPSPMSYETSPFPHRLLMLLLYSTQQRPDILPSR
jgi:hypothetical protein